MINLKYIPILKWKRAEYRALSELREIDKDKITPLVELVLPMVPLYKDKKKNIKKTQDEMLIEMVSKFREKRTTEIPEEILKSWGKNPFYLDLSLIYDLEFSAQLIIDSFNKITSIGMGMGLHIIPVVNLSDSIEFKKTVALFSKKYLKGICLKITPADFSNLEKEISLDKKIETLLVTLDLKRENIDLLIDIKEKSNQYSKYIKAIQITKQIMDWRNLIFACGAFPENLNDCKLDEDTHLPRLDWQNWLLHARSKQLKRNPVFADYTIRNPIFKESLQYYSSTTSIKYTLDNDWVVLKGKKLDFPLFLVNAKLLVEDSGYFYGENFSAGDKYITLKAKHYYEYIKTPSIKGTGRSEDWIAAGINHHIAVVLNQISNLS